MSDYMDIVKMVDEDIKLCTDTYKNYSHDREIMEELFNKILFKYYNIVESFSCGLKVISSYEENIKMASIYRINVVMLIKKLKDFKNNNYSNEGLFYNNLNNMEGTNFKFNEVRQYIIDNKHYSKKEKEEIIDKVDDVEEIIMAARTKREKWEMLRPYVMWVSGKDVEFSMKMIPLFLVI